MESFVEDHVNPRISKGKQYSVLDVGSYDVNGTFRSFFESEYFDYIGLDIRSGNNVDIVPKDPYCWEEIADETFDFVVSGSAFEHIEFPWLTIEQISRKLKKSGLACIIAPSAGPEHRHPVDCYRYYQDGMRALAKWAKLDIVSITISDGGWKDVCAILEKP